MKILKLFFWHIFMKSGSIYIRQTPKWSISPFYTWRWIYFTGKNV